MEIIYFLISFAASVVGSICGIGGGVIIKPTLDFFHLASVPTASFLSGCTVLTMSFYSVSRSMIVRDSKVNMKIGTPLAMGAAFGGLLGKYIFDCLKTILHSFDIVGEIQSICLAIITIGTLLYTINKNKIKTLQLTNKLGCILIGLCLGIMSSFLGIGGGPINLVVLFYFFSMDTKTAAQNSLYIILISQFFSMFFTLVTNTVPEFSLFSLVVMMLGGIFGGILGRILSKHLNDKTVNNLFLILMCIIILICCYNIYHFKTA